MGEKSGKLKKKIECLSEPALQEASYESSPITRATALKVLPQNPSFTALKVLPRTRATALKVLP